MVLVF